MGSVPALSVLILGIVVPALAGYIEVSHLKCSLVYLRQFPLKYQNLNTQFAGEKKMFSAYIYPVVMVWSPNE